MQTSSHLCPFLTHHYSLLSSFLPFPTPPFPNSFFYVHYSLILPFVPLTPLLRFTSGFIVLPLLSLILSFLFHLSFSFLYFLIFFLSFLSSSLHFPYSLTPPPPLLPLPHFQDCPQVEPKRLPNPHKESKLHVQLHKELRLNNARYFRSV